MFSLISIVDDFYQNYYIKTYFITLFLKAQNKLPEDEMLKIRVHLAQSMALNFVNTK